jgi:(S)-2-hydroxy-acid oxidase
MRLNEARNDISFPDHIHFPLVPFNGPNSGDVTTDALMTAQDFTYDPTPSWDEVIPWLRSLTKMQIWLKGVYTPDDVRLAISHGIDGVIISNHGGRQLDGVPATLDALRDCSEVIAEASKSGRDRIRIAIDGGIRRGSDIFKALALGADFCFIGRIAQWGLAVS